MILDQSFVGWLPRRFQRGSRVCQHRVGVLQGAVGKFLIAPVDVRPLFTTIQATDRLDSQLPG